jgi:hypothetical protein
MGQDKAAGPARGLPRRLRPVGDALRGKARHPGYSLIGDQRVGMGEIEAPVAPAAPAVSALISTSGSRRTLLASGISRSSQLKQKAMNPAPDAT